jgi:hypothetical protein
MRDRHAAELVRVQAVRYLKVRYVAITKKASGNRQRVLLLLRHAYREAMAEARCSDVSNSVPDSLPVGRHPLTGAAVWRRIPDLFSSRDKCSGSFSNGQRCVKRRIEPVV